MSSGKEDLIKQVLEEFTGILQLKLPLQYICPFYDDSLLNNLAQEEAKKVLMNFQNNSKLDMQETLGVVTELFSKFQEAIGEWKVKNKENKTQCDLFLQSQVDFLLSDFTTSVFIKLVSAPDVGLAELETFLERRKTVLIDIFEKLSKPGQPQSISSVNMKTSLDEKLECVKIETLEKQRLHLEQKASVKAQKVLEHVKAIIMKKARQLVVELKSDQGKYPRDLLRGKLAEIDNYLSTKGKVLNECHLNIYSAVLRTTAEVRKCLDLMKVLLDDFGGENYHVEEDSSEVESVSRDESACAISGSKAEKELRTGREPNEVSSSASEADQCHHNQVQTDFGEEEGIEEETDVAAPIFQSGVEDGDSMEEEAEEEIEMEKSTKFAEVGLGIRPKNPYSNTVNRRSARFKESSEPVAVAAMQSRPKRNCVVAGIKRKYCDDIDSEESSDDDYQDSSTSGDSDEEEEVVAILPPRRLQATVSCSRKKSGRGSKTKSNPGKRPFKCTKCLESFSEGKYFNKHMRCHDQKARYVCKTCKMSFISNRGLHAHKNLKHREKLLFGCSYCDERFNKTTKLKAHVMYRHTDIRPFRCPMCGVSSINKYTLARHIQKIHSESKQVAQSLANEVAVNYLVKETKDESYRDIPEESINSLVVSHVIKKANLKIPQRTTHKAVRVHRKKNLPRPVKSALSVLHGSRNGK